MKGFIIALALPFAFAAEMDKTRVFITDSDSWEVGGGFGAGASGGTGAGAGRLSGGARPQTVEVIKNFRDKCPQLTVTMDKTKFQYVILFDREGGKEIISRDNKIAVFKSDGDLLYSGSTRILGNAINDACRAIQKDR